MKFFKRVLVLVLLQMVLFNNIVISNAVSGSSNISLSHTSVNVGDKVTVTLTVSAEPSFGACVYSIDYSSNLRLVSGDARGTLEATAPNTTSQSTTLTFEAVSSGSASVSASISQAITWNDESISVSSSSRTITIVAPSTGSNQGGSNSNNGNSSNSNTPTLSSNTNLTSLIISEGELLPEFSHEVTGYNVVLPEGSTSIEISAQAEDSSAAVSGVGLIELEPGNNTVNIVVTAEDGTTKTYTIFVNVLYPPLFTFEVDGLTYGVIADFTDLVVPEGFIESTVLIGGKEAPCWNNSVLQLTLLYLNDENGVNSLYIYDQTLMSLYKYMEVVHLDLVFISLPLTDEMKERVGFVASELELQGNVVQVLKYQEENLLANQLSIVYLMNQEGEKALYTYDAEEKVLQRFYSSADLNLTELNNLKEEHLEALNNKEQLIYILVGVSSVLLCSLVVVSALLMIKNKKIKKSLNYKIIQEEVDIEDEIIDEEAE